MIMCLIHDLEVKGHKCQGQRSHGSGLKATLVKVNKDSKERQVGSQQCEVASLLEFGFMQQYAATKSVLGTEGHCILTWHSVPLFNF